MTEITRREALTTLAFARVAAVTSCAGAQAARPGASSPNAAPKDKTMMNYSNALPGNHTVVPLPYAPASLNGLSERLIVVAALREKELTFRNSKSLHELYFANLGGNGKRSGAIESALTQSYDTSARWEQQMRATAAGLGGGSGWAVLAFELDTGALRTIAAGNHTQTLALAAPLLVLDMYEHSYQMDFGAAAARYSMRSSPM